MSGSKYDALIQNKHLPAIPALRFPGAGRYLLYPASAPVRAGAGGQAHPGRPFTVVNNQMGIHRHRAELKAEASLAGWEPHAAGGWYPEKLPGTNLHILPTTQYSPNPPIQIRAPVSSSCRAIAFKIP